MMKMIKNRAAPGIAAAGVWLAAVCAAAAPGALETGQASSVPESVSYRGRLAQNGIPVTGTRNALFRVYDALSGGNLLWQEAAVLSCDGGLFNAPLSLSTAALSGGGARYLEAEVEGSILAPREVLASQPYAQIAKSVEGGLEISGGGLAVSSAPASEFLLYVSSQTGLVGLGTSAPAYRLDVHGDVRSTGAVTAAGLEGATGSLSGAAFTVGGTALTVGASGVGVGTASPDQRLSVAGGVTNSGVWISSGSGANVFLGSVGIGTAAPVSRLTVVDGDIRLSTRSLAAANFYFWDGTFLPSANLGSAGILAHPDDAVAHGDSDADGSGRVLLRTGAADRLVVSAAGNVGVGTADPAALLDVAGESQFGAGAAKSTFTAAGRLALVAGSTVSAGGAMSFSTAATAAATGLPALHIDAAGRVGIGTTAPSSAAHAAGDIRAESGFRAGAALGLKGGSATHLEAGSAANVELQFVAGAAAPGFYVAADGNVGVATATPRGLLHVGAGDVLALVVTGAGAAGIGTSNPATRLHLSSGVLLADGSLSGLAVGVSTLVVVAGSVGVGQANPSVIFEVGTGTLAVTAGAQVGIRTSNPLATLDVRGSAQFGAGAAKSTITASGNIVLPAGGNVTAATFNGGTPITDPLAVTYILNGSPSIRTTSRPGLEIATHVWVTGGRFGIGTTSPAALLHLSSESLTVDGAGGGLAVGISTFVAGKGRVGIGTSQPAARFHMSSGGFTLDGAGAAVVIGDSTFTVTSVGVGLGAVNPASPLHVSSGVVTIDGTGAGLSVDSTLLFAAGGRVGVGTSLPALTLDVEGPAQWGLGAARSTITASGDLQLAAGSTVTSAGTFSLSTAPSAALTGLPAVFIDREGKVGFGLADPASRLAVGGRLTGSAASASFSVNAGPLGSPAGSVARPASLGVLSGDGVALTAKGFRAFGAGAGWTTASVGLELETDNALQAGASVWLSAAGVGIGTAAPASLLNVYDGDLVITDPGASRGIIYQDGSVQVTASGNSPWFKIGDNAFTNNSGNLGIGTTAPGSKIDIQGRIRLNGDSLQAAVPQAAAARLDSGLSSIVGDCPLFSAYEYYDSGAATWRYTSNGRAGFHWGACGDVWYLATSPISGGSGAGTPASTAVRLSVLPDGKVGIGTNAPGVNLEISDSAGPSINLSRDGSNTWFLTATPAGTNRLGFRPGSNTDGAEILTLLATGRLGVGLTAPVNRLDVKGNMSVGGFAGTAAAPANSLVVSGLVGIGSASPSAAVEIAATDEVGLRYIRTDAPDSRISVGDLFKTWSAAVGWGTSNEFSFIEEGVSGDTFYIKSDGKVGIGLANPANQLDVAGAVGIGAYAVEGGINNRLIVSGKVGIGVTDPLFSLEVLGEIRATDGAGAVHLYSHGRLGTMRYGLTGVETGLCQAAGAGAGSARFGLSMTRVKWEGSAGACPRGTWVCTRQERCGDACDGSDACDTARPDSPTCDYRDGSFSGTLGGMPCVNQTPDQHWGHVADNTFQGSREGDHVNENGSLGGGGGGQYEMPVWCCSD